MWTLPEQRDLSILTLEIDHRLDSNTSFQTRATIKDIKGFNVANN